MKTIFYITGSSRGIGFHLTNEAIADKDTFVYGIARTPNITHSRYQHLSMDLSCLEQMENLSLPVAKNAEKVVLVNNAGMLGTIAPVGELDTQSIIKTHTLNIIAPTVLSNRIIQTYGKTVKEIVILNISSGVANYPIHGWANYCASKAAVNMLTRVLNLENDSGNVKAFAVAPGIVDTGVQTEIRSASPNAFPDLPRFVEYKEEGLLSNPEDVAKGLMEIIDSPHHFGDEILDLRKI